MLGSIAPEAHVDWIPFGKITLPNGVACCGVIKAVRDGVAEKDQIDRHLLNFHQDFAMPFQPTQVIPVFPEVRQARYGFDGSVRRSQPLSFIKF